MIKTDNHLIVDMKLDTGAAGDSICVIGIIAAERGNLI